MAAVVAANADRHLGKLTLRLNEFLGAKVILKNLVRGVDSPDRVSL